MAEMTSKAADLLDQRKKHLFNLNNNLELVFYTFYLLSTTKMLNSLSRLEFCLGIQVVKKFLIISITKEKKIFKLNPVSDLGLNTEF